MDGGGGHNRRAGRAWPRYDGVMRSYRLRRDLQRARLGRYALPLGIVPGDIDPPREGYTIEYAPGDEDGPDSYSFHFVVSHERVAPLIRRLFDLLPGAVYGIVEIESWDAYRVMDVYLGRDLIGHDEFLNSWRYFEPFLLEDGSVAAGVNSEEPFIEIMLDQWKGVWAHVPISRRDEVEEIAEALHINEVERTWPREDDEHVDDGTMLREVLALDDEFSPDLTEMILQLRRAWDLELNVDPAENLDDGGRRLGRTLWHAMVVVESKDDPALQTYASIWATAGSILEIEQILLDALAPHPQFNFVEIYTLDRVAYDDRPDELADLPPRLKASGVHLVQFDPVDTEQELS
jgi:hypothetical protein